MSCKVLMIDDDARYLDLLAMMLEDHGFEVKSCTKPDQFITALNEFKPDALVIDILIGSISGIELAGSIRLDHMYADIPIVFMSAWTGVGHHRLPSNSNKLYKPFTIRELTDSIETLLVKSGKLRVEKYDD